MGLLSDLWGFPQLGVSFGGSHDKGYGASGSLFMETTI